MGGRAQIDRINKDKIRSLKKALWYSYQSATLVTEDEKEFRCLINPNKLNNDYDVKKTVEFINSIKINEGDNIND